ncbi:hypothetical protein PPL19_11442 [Pseudomonas psychrotolerans L19]|nr:hypothetical protein PPL19_11442 [Pseudomonas psychrotolerans L19]
MLIEVFNKNTAKIRISIAEKYIYMQQFKRYQLAFLQTRLMTDKWTT